MAKKRKITRKQKQAEEPKEANIESNEQPEPNLETNEQHEANLETNEQHEVNLETNEQGIEACTDNMMQVEENIENEFEIGNDAMENETDIQHTDESTIQKKKARGQTRMKRLPSDRVSRINVEFNDNVVPIGEGSIKLSSYLGPLVREHVPFTIDDWRNIGDDLKHVLWRSIQVSLY